MTKLVDKHPILDLAELKDYKKQCIASSRWEDRGKFQGSCWVLAPLNPMSCLSWNYLGLGNPQIEDELVALVSNKGLKLVFLIETKVEKVILDRICRKIQFANLFVVPCHNQGGGCFVLACRYDN